MGRAIIGVGSGSGLTARALAAKSGAETVVIASGNLPLHQHTLSAHTHTSAQHSHGLNSHTHTSAEHSHGLNSHTHTSAEHSHGLNSHTHTSAEHSHGLGGHTHVGGSHAHNIPRGLIAAAGTNRAVVSTNNDQATINVVAGGQVSSGAPSGGSDNATPGATGGPNQTNTTNTTPGNTGAPTSTATTTTNTTPGPTGGPNQANTTDTTPGPTGGPSSDTTGNGGFANTALGLMNPFLALNYIIKY
jgi:microcystin-dependent protein